MLKTGQFIIFSLLCLMIYSSCSKQSGCIDPNAANYIYEAQKDDGSCLYDLSFWMNTPKHGQVYIYIDGEYRDYLNCYWNAKKPRCGVDTTVAPGFKCTSNIALNPGSYSVRIEADDGTIWEKTYTLPENCLSILVTAVE